MRHQHTAQDIVRQMRLTGSINEPGYPRIHSSKWSQKIVLGPHGDTVTIEGLEVVAWTSSGLRTTTPGKLAAVLAAVQELDMAEERLERSGQIDAPTCWVVSREPWDGGPIAGVRHCLPWPEAEPWIKQYMPWETDPAWYYTYLGQHLRCWDSPGVARQEVALFGGQVLRVDCRDLRRDTLGLPGVVPPEAVTIAGPYYAPCELVWYDGPPHQGGQQTQAETICCPLEEEGNHIGSLAWLPGGESDHPLQCAIDSRNTDLAEEHPGKEVWWKLYQLTTRKQVAEGSFYLDPSEIAE